MLKGRCLCGEIQFTVKDEFLYAGYCHCSQCRHYSGASGSAIGGVAMDALALESGKDSISRYQKTEDSILCFCSKCGSSLFGEKPQSGLVHIRYGSLDDSPTILPQAHMHTSSKAAWYEILDDLPQFTELPE